ncbi:MAG: energy-coupling factor transporter transmembrane protein EcfT [Erysipelotrichaceae bacterium]|nr:energy-coupling factor transporter transmembrane protein EcfT [Erysipelotrichaceae bacterium]MDD3923802.1 energy-coupling factor transporter transmembrane protein EcfT [Erysipelotrichaceae bacterium]MDD4641879.1 energy-coupling factor transporter transmembrane protein EcfT [Erysipelotrichaceae bacterium]
MDSIALGRYIPGTTLIHRLDPRIKILSMLFLLIAIFIPAGFYGYLVITIVSLLALSLAKLRIGFVFKALRPIMIMMIMLMVINVLVVKTGYVIITFLGFEIYSGAIYQTLYIFIRLVLMIVITTILTATTKPLELTLGIEDLLAPFVRFKVPAHEIAMMISIAIRFIPTLIEETQRIMKAQASRGVDLKEGKFKEKIAAILSLIVPLFVSSFQRAEDLANAMEARGYVPDAKRTRYKQLHVDTKDRIILLFVILILVGLIKIAIFI